MAPLPPGLFSTTMGCGRYFSLSLAADSVRAKMSLPPAGPGVDDQLIGFSGNAAA